MEFIPPEAKALKDEGNVLFGQTHFARAIEKYAAAIRLVESPNPFLAILYSNKSKCEILLENYGIAAEDARKSIENDMTFSKGYYRLASALFALNKINESIAALDKIHNVCNLKDNDEVNEMLKKLKKIKTERDFFGAFGYEEKYDVTISEDTIVVENTYKGPSFEGEIDLEWVKKLAEFLRGQNKLHKKFAWRLIRKAIEVFSKEPNIVDFSLQNEVENITVCGDIHGQYYDLLNIFSKNGYPTEKRPYLFNGDFVDRGSFSVEVILLLIAFKVANPKCIFLNRGNHENPEMNRLYGFEGEVKAKYCSKTFTFFTNLFFNLPLATLISKKIFVLHGGLFSEEGVKLDDLKKINRVCAIPPNGNMCDMLWADPKITEGKKPNMRGVSIEFGPDVTKKFLHDNNLGWVIRSDSEESSGEGGWV